MAFNWVPGCALAALLVAIVRTPVWLHHDVAQLDQTGQLLLMGQRPYLDFIDISPPLVYYLHAAIRWVGGFLPGSPHPFLVVNLFVLLLTAYAAAGAYRSIRDSVDPPRAVAAAVLASGVVVYSCALFSERLYGEREHLFLLTCIPFQLVRFLRYAQRPVATHHAAVAGVMAGIFSCIKPHFAFVLWSYDGLLLLCTRRWRCLNTPEVKAALLMYALYLVHFAFLPRDVRDAFLFRWVPLISAHYGAYAQNLSDLVKDSATMAGLRSALLALPLCVWGTVPDRLLAAWALTLALSGTLIYLAQSKGWLYHTIPLHFAELLVFLLYGLRLGRWLGRRTGALEASFRPVAKIAPWATVAVLTFAAVEFGRLGEATARSLADLASESMETALILKYSRPGDRVMILSTKVRSPYPALPATGRLPGTRYTFLFPLPMYFDRRPSAAGPYTPSDPTGEALLISELCADLDVLRPTLILIPAGSDMALPEGFDMLEYFTRRGLTKKILERYRYEGRQKGLHVYRLENTSAKADAKLSRS